jgi:hypothetical protein
MASGDNRVSIVKDDVGKVFASLRELLGKQVLIGVPEDKQHAGTSITNATIAYVMEFGSPAQNIPARAFLVPGVEKARANALNQIRKAADAALSQDPKAAMQHLAYAGMVGAESVRQEILTGDFAPLSPATIRARARARGDKTRRENEIGYLNMVASGIDPGAAQSEAGIRPLINTGELFRSITYVVREV